MPMMMSKNFNVLDSLTAQKSTYLGNETLAEVTGGDVTNPD